MSNLRNLSAKELVKGLSTFEYVVTRQVGSHMRLTTMKNGQHHITIPNHDPLKIGTLSSILRNIGEHHSLTKEEVWEIILGGI